MIDQNSLEARAVKARARAYSDIDPASAILHLQLALAAERNALRAKDVREDAVCPTAYKY